MTDESIITQNFKGWKIGLAILIGLAAASYMLVSSLNTTSYVGVENGAGTHQWIDSNNNGKIDLDLPEEFKPSSSGNYKQVDFYSAFSQINWNKSSLLFIVLAILLTMSRDFFYMVRIRLLTKNDLTWKASFYVIMIWEFASALTPGVVGGAAVAMFILNKEKISLGRSTAIVFITAMMDNLFYVIMIPLVFIFISSSDLFPASTGIESSVEWVFWIGFAVIFSACLFLFLSIFVWPQLAKGFLKFVFSLPFLKRWKTNALKIGDEIKTTSTIMRKEPFVFWFKVFGATFFSWISRYLVINALLQAFIGIGIFEHIQLLGKQLILWLFMLVSPTPGGSGVAEYAFGELLAPFSTSAILLVFLAIIWRLISYFPYLFIGAILVPRWLRTKKSN